MNPLDLTGVPFLFFYAVTAGLIYALVSALVRAREAAWPVPKLELTDPYEIAMLRGGENEALRIAVLSLVDRGLLNASGLVVSMNRKPIIDAARRPIEKALIKKFEEPAEAITMFTDYDLKVVCLKYKAELLKHRLLATPAIQGTRLPPVLFGMAIMVGLAGLKIDAAISRGHRNFGILVVFAFAAVVALLRIVLRGRTGLGDRVLKDLRTLFRGLKERVMLIEKGGATNEAALLAAVFGISAFAHVLFPYAEGLFPKAAKQSGLAWGGEGSDCSSCGASCGSSCGSSCGGGGCGGGCGGCGS